MKTITFLTFVVFTITTLYSQSYEIDFTGTGDTTIVDSVKVENLNQGITLTLKGDDILKLNITTGIHNNACDIKSLQVYPNPMTDQAEIQFFVNKSGNVLVGIYDVSGRSVIQSDMFLHMGMHEYRISGLHQGMYIVRINEQNSFYTAKLISQNQLKGEAEIELVSSENIQLNQTQTKQLKSTASTIETSYNEGDRLLFKGMTGNYATIITDVPSGNNTIIFDFMDCTDADSNHYPVVKIGCKVWMAANLKTTRYADGTAIPLVTGNVNWKALPITAKAYCWYNDDSATNANTYGALYTWTAATNNTDSILSSSSIIQGVCPTGWHVSNDDEWTTLLDYFGGRKVAGGKLKETGTTHWQSPNTGATNESGFTALPGGFRFWDGTFYEIGCRGYWWSSLGGAESYSARFRFLDYYGIIVLSSYTYMRNGSSVRCVRNKFIGFI